ncbi:MAG TPA: NAD-binding protein [Candidatus Limnocylindrales bacterium]|nr:NAD-binding protein [Candidatus Limnocylindrales bacterium]
MIQERTSPPPKHPGQRAWAVWRRRGRRAWEAARWIVIAGLFFAALGLGWIGFDLNSRALGQPASFLDSLYRSLQLFILHSGAVPPPVPWQLEIARLLAPAVAAGATLSAIVDLLGEQLSGLRVRFYSNHVVVCGLGRLGSLLARTLRDAGYDVVGIESDAQSGAISRCREDGIVVLVGDGTYPEMLRKARAHRARYLFAVAGDDGRNSDIAIGATELADGRSGSPLTCFVHVIDDKLSDVLRQVGLSRRGGGLRIEYFNVAELGAPTLLADYPAFDDQGNTPLGPPHLVVVGLGEMGTRLVAHAARRWRSIPGVRGKKLRITAVDLEADARVALLNERQPRLADVCELRPCRMDLDSAEFERADFLFGRRGKSDVTGVYVCVGEDAVGLRAALHLRHRLGDRNVPIVVRTTQEEGVAALLGGEDRGTFGNLSVFGLLNHVCRPDVLLAGQNEVLARAIHGNYVSSRRREGESVETNPSMVDWERLPESLKESNRQQATDICRKLEAIGCEIVPMTDWDAEPLVFTTDEIEPLAIAEHDRWRREREAAGWRLAATRSEGRKESPYLIPYEDLPADVKEIDRAAVRAVPALLAEVDFAVVRVRRGNDGATPS